MFDLESDDLQNIKKKKLDDYDYEYALAVSRSILDMAGSQIWTPEEVQKYINTKLEEL